jgi:hypothetical protein
MDLVEAGRGMGCGMKLMSMGVVAGRFGAVDVVKVLVVAVDHGRGGLRRRVRRFESCRGHTF